eukprot:gb/GFBE01068329.1/.p1 GENE.gb/GFBE01068329.1/~~gb/GFBE01068329.1/.p1  ORF type:complete len:624 (+),score=86.18 gb/GFBE01068329.1/:1-1872(+)
MLRCFEGRRRAARSRSPRERSGARELPSGASNASLTSNASATAASAPELHVLYASPLDQRLPQMNIQAELDLLQESLQKANCSMNVSVGIATTKALAQLLTLARAVGSVILHLSVHVVAESNGAGLVFENAHGGAHILYRAQLEELLGSSQQLDGLSLVFVNGCSSEKIAELLVESGCRLVIATRGKVLDVAATTFTQQFYYSLGSQESVRSAFQSAQKVLRVDPNPKVKESADMFVLFGQRNACSRTLSRESTPSRAGLESPTSQSSLLVESSEFGFACACPLPPRVEDWQDRSKVLCDILRNFDSSGGAPRRACVLFGPEGIGKTAVATELAHFASAPGRLFSRSVMFVSLDGRPELGSVLAGIVRCLAARQPPLLREESTLRLESEQELMRGLQRLDQLRGRRHLLILDDQCGAVRGSPEVRGLLSRMLETAKNLSFVVCSRDQVYESLGSCKCVNMQLPALTNLESAMLFLKRTHRPLHPCDLDRGAPARGALQNSNLVLQKLASHPLLQQLGGNPGRVRAVSESVIPELRSLFDLCSNSPGQSSNTGGALLRTMSVDDTVQAGSSSLVRGMSEDSLDGTQLTRSMSLDGPPLARMMSVDGAPLTRMMSIDETQPSQGT